MRYFGTHIVSSRQFKCSLSTAQRSLYRAAYIGPKSITERPMKTKIGTEVAHVTCDSDTTFKVKRSKIKVTRPLYSPQP